VYGHVSNKHKHKAWEHGPYLPFLFNILLLLEAVVVEALMGAEAAQEAI
jgi:hypothetical protein